MSSAFLQRLFRAPGAESERQRVPQPMIKRRIASGRGAMEQPNVTDDGEAKLTALFWVCVVITGIITGLIGDGLMAVLKVAEHGAFGYQHGSYALAVAHNSASRRVLMLLLSGLVGAGGWFLIRQYLSHEHAEIDDAIWNGDGELGFRRSSLTSVVSEIVIGLGA